MSDSSQPSPTRRRFKLQFTLRMLLVVTAVLALWLNFQLDRARRQQAAVKAIQAYGGMVRYDFEPEDPKLRKPPPEPKWLVDLVGVDFLHNIEAVNFNCQFKDGQRVENSRETADILQELQDLPGLKSIMIQGSQATNESMKTVARLDSLEELWVFTHYFMEGNKQRASRPKLTDQGITQLAILKRLRILYIDDAPLGDRALATISQFQRLENLTLQGPGYAFSDEGLAALARLQHLRTLRFDLGYGSTNFSDAGVASVAGLHRLEELGLRGEEISDQALEQLAAMPALKELYVASKSITPEGMSRFQQATPGLKCSFSTCASFGDDMRRIVASVLKIKPANVTPQITLGELGMNQRQRNRLIRFLRNDYFQFDPDDAPNLRSFLAEVDAAEDPTVQQLADLVQKYVGR
jgi:hypothetical protein